jgi:hypothetical protein
MSHSKMNDTDFAHLRKPSIPVLELQEYAIADSKLYGIGTTVSYHIRNTSLLFYLSCASRGDRTHEESVTKNVRPGVSRKSEGVVPRVFW